MKKLVLLALLAATSVGATLGFGDHAVSANKGLVRPALCHVRPADSDDTLALLSHVDGGRGGR